MTVSSYKKGNLVQTYSADSRHWKQGKVDSVTVNDDGTKSYRIVYYEDANVPPVDNVPVENIRGGYVAGGMFYDSSLGKWSHIKYSQGDEIQAYYDESIYVTSSSWKRWLQGKIVSVKVNDDGELIYEVQYSDYKEDDNKTYPVSQGKVRDHGAKGGMWWDDDYYDVADGQWLDIPVLEVRYSPGQKVQIEYGNEWYQGRILADDGADYDVEYCVLFDDRLHKNELVTSCDVSSNRIREHSKAGGWRYYNDPDKAVTLPHHDSEVPNAANWFKVPYEKGQFIQVRIENGTGGDSNIAKNWYQGEIISVSGRDSYKVRFPDGNTRDGIQSVDIRGHVEIGGMAWFAEDDSPGWGIIRPHGKGGSEYYYGDDTVPQVIKGDAEVLPAVQTPTLAQFFLQGDAQVAFSEAGKNVIEETFKEVIDLHSEGGLLEIKPMTTQGQDVGRVQLSHFLDRLIQDLSDFKKDELDLNDMEVEKLMNTMTTDCPTPDCFQQKADWGLFQAMLLEAEDINFTDMKVPEIWGRMDENVGPNEDFGDTLELIKQTMHTQMNKVMEVVKEPAAGDNEDNDDVDAADAAENCCCC